MLVTAAVFQSVIPPYVDVAVPGLVTQSLTAVAMFLCEIAVWQLTGVRRKRSSNTTLARAFDVSNAVPFTTEADLSTVTTVRRPKSRRSATAFRTFLLAPPSGIARETTMARPIVSKSDGMPHCRITPPLA
jgi:hypothetical protein